MPTGPLMTDCARASCSLSEGAAAFSPPPSPADPRSEKACARATASGDSVSFPQNRFSRAGCAASFQPMLASISTRSSRRMVTGALASLDTGVGIAIPTARLRRSCSTSSVVTGTGGCTGGGGTSASARLGRLLALLARVAASSISESTASTAGSAGEILPSAGDAPDMLMLTAAAWKLPSMCPP